MLPIDIYISKGTDSDPNNFVFDISMKNVTTTVTFDAQSLDLAGQDGYSVALHVNALDLKANELLSAAVDITVTEFI